MRDWLWALVTPVLLQITLGVLAATMLGYGPREWVAGMGVFACPIVGLVFLRRHRPFLLTAFPYYVVMLFVLRVVAMDIAGRFGQA